MMVESCWFGAPPDLPHVILSFLLTTQALLAVHLFPEDAIIPIFPSNCSDEVPVYRATNGTVIFVAGDCLTTDQDLRCDWILEAPPGQFLTASFVEFRHPLGLEVIWTFYCAGAEKQSLRYYDGPSENDRLLGIFCSDFIFPPVHAKSNVVRMSLRVQNGSYFPSLKIRFRATIEPKYARINVTFISEDTGYIASPGYDGLTRHPEYMDDEYLLHVPQGFSVMYTFLDLAFFMADICESHVSVYTVDAEGDRNLEGVYCDTRQTYTKGIVANSSLLFHLTTLDAGTGYAGFKLAFSIYRQEDLPQRICPNQVSGPHCGKGSAPLYFDCSGVQYETFRHHVECDLLQDCLNYEDEPQCPSTGHTCSAHLPTHDKCYRLLSDCAGPGPCQMSVTATWNHAASECRERGGRLFSIKTPSDLQAVRKFLFLTKRNKIYYFTGLRPASASVPVYYQNTFQHTDGTINYFMDTKTTSKYDITGHLCVSLDFNRATGFETLMHGCSVDPHIISRFTGVETVCEFRKQGFVKNETKIVLPVPKNPLYTRCLNRPIPEMRKCASGHVTHQFMQCEQSNPLSKASILQADLLSSEEFAKNTFKNLPSCKKNNSDCTSVTRVDSSVQWFTCGGRQLPYTLVCDFRTDCANGEDEEFCRHPVCLTGQAECRNGQCVEQWQWCDGRQHCADRSDEEFSVCRTHIHDRLGRPEGRIAPPAVVLFDGYGGFRHDAVDDFNQCPETHFQCPDSYCLPVYLRCNKVYDCPGWEDEADCPIYTCPGFYRCRHSAVCLHADHVCDGVFQCPRQDDELLCGLSCPEGCQCQGLAFVCATLFAADQHHHVRYVDASGSDMTPEDFLHNHYLVYLRLANCGLQRIGRVPLSNLQTLDLSHNCITQLVPDSLSLLVNLKHLILSHNPIVSLEVIQEFQAAQGFKADNSMPRGVTDVSNLEHLDLSHTALTRLSSTSLAPFPRLMVLNISYSQIDSITDDCFNRTVNLAILDMQGLVFDTIPSKLLKHLFHLKEIRAEDFRLCCKANLPDSFDRQSCFVQNDQLSSCSSLLATEMHRVFVWCTAAVAAGGNGGLLLLMRGMPPGIRQSSLKPSFVSVCVADFLMGMYLAAMGVADQMHRGVYVTYDAVWRHSTGCSLAAVLFSLSRHISTLSGCIFTAGRFMLSVKHRSSMARHLDDVMSSTITQSDSDVTRNPNNVFARNTENGATDVIKHSDDVMTGMTAQNGSDVTRNTDSAVSDVVRHSPIRNNQMAGLNRRHVSFHASMYFPKNRFHAKHGIDFFKSTQQVHRADMMACVFVWMTSLILAVIPILSRSPQWNFVSHSTVCLPLPISTGFTSAQQFLPGRVCLLVLQYAVNLAIAVVTVVVFILTWLLVRCDGVKTALEMSVPIRLNRSLAVVILADATLKFFANILGIANIAGLTLSENMLVILAIFFAFFPCALNPLLTLYAIVHEKHKTREIEEMVRAIQQNIKRDKIERT